VIVHGTRAEVDAVAARYNLRVARYLKSGGVLLVNAGQLTARPEDRREDFLGGPDLMAALASGASHPGREHGRGSGAAGR